MRPEGFHGAHGEAGTCDHAQLRMLTENSSPMSLCRSPVQFICEVSGHVNVLSPAKGFLMENFSGAQHLAIINQRV